MKFLFTSLFLWLSLAVFCQQTKTPEEVSKLIGKPYRWIPFSGKGAYKTEAEFNRSVKDRKFSKFQTFHRFGKYDVVVTYRLNKKEKFYYYSDIVAFYPKRSREGYREELRIQGFVLSPGKKGDHREMTETSYEVFKKLFIPDLKNPKELPAVKETKKYRFEDGIYAYTVNETPVGFYIEYGYDHDRDLKGIHRKD